MSDRSPETSISLRPLTREEVRSIDVRAIEEFEIPGLLLMENAGRNAAEIIIQRFSERRNHTKTVDRSARPLNVLIVCGKGNNGGDGYVIARHLQAAGHNPQIYSLVPATDLTGDAAANHRIATDCNIPIAYAGDDDAHADATVPPECDVIVDCLLGTGLQGVPREPFARMISILNETAAKSQIPIVAIDIPSGLNCDAGHAAGACINATLTVTFVSTKVGFATKTAQKFLGEVIVTGIGAPATLLREFETSS